MKPFRLFLTSIALVLFTCNSKNKTEGNLLQTEDSNKTNTTGTVANTNTAVNLPYWDSTIWHNGITGYVDTFSVGGTNFRVVDSSYDSVSDRGFEGELQKFAEGKWKHILTVELGMHNNYSRLKDANGDGYIDFIHDMRYGSDVYFFLPNKKDFDTAIGFELPQEWTLLDTVHNIYCDNDNVKGIEDNSRLYTFNGIVPVVLYTLYFDHEYSKKEDAKMTTTMSLYKGSLEFKNSSALIRSTPINKISDDFDIDFDYADYWRKNYKQLLGYQ